MEERRLVHRGASVFDGEQERAVLDHLLEEDAFDRLVVTAYVGHVEAVDGEECDDAGDRSDREEVAKAVRVGARGVRRVVWPHRVIVCAHHSKKGSNRCEDSGRSTLTRSAICGQMALRPLPACVRGRAASAGEAISDGCSIGMTCSLARNDKESVLISRVEPYLKS